MKTQNKPAPISVHPVPDKEIVQESETLEEMRKETNTILKKRQKRHNKHNFTIRPFILQSLEYQDQSLHTIAITKYCVSCHKVQAALVLPKDAFENIWQCMGFGGNADAYASIR